MTFSLVVPVYKNEGAIPELVRAVARIDEALEHRLEAVFVVDGSPDRCFEHLQVELSKARFRAKLILLSRNFGSFAAIKAGLTAATGRYFAVMAADLQEPPELLLEFYAALASEQVDVTLGVRAARSDPWASRVGAGLFWWAYRRFIQPEVPPGGVDVFGCNRAFRDHLLRLDEANSSLIGQIIWLGFRRKAIPYRRLPRRHGQTAWTLRRKATYLMDSMFAFSDLPIRALIAMGAVGLAIAVVLSLVVVGARLSGRIPVPGYAGTVLTITFFAAFNSLGLGIVGSYTWRAYENTKRRPHAVVLLSEEFPARADT
jgi:polyisoprenyl-phosphate glycosyltransferase